MNCASAESIGFRYRVEAADESARVQLRLIVHECGDEACLGDSTLEEHWYSFFDVLVSNNWRSSHLSLLGGCSLSLPV